MLINNIQELALCAGTGMLSVGIEIACTAIGINYEVAGFSEINEHANKILKLRFPDIPNLGDLKNLKSSEATLISAGFPCQPFSVAGKHKGLGDSRNLLGEIISLIEKSRPPLVFLENVPSFRAIGLEVLLNELTKLGYNAEWSNLQASAVGATHKRNRFFLLAYTSGTRLEVGKSKLGDFGEKCKTFERIGDFAPISQNSQFSLFAPDRRFDFGRISENLQPSVKSKFFRVADGMASRVDRLRAIGNGVVPLQAAWAFIGLAKRAEII